MPESARRTGGFEVVLVVLSIISLFLEQHAAGRVGILVVTNTLDLTILILLIGEVVVDLRRATYPMIYLRRNAAGVLFTAIFVALFLYTKYELVVSLTGPGRPMPLTAVAARTIFLILKVATRFRRITAFMESINAHPAQTVVLSFILVILAGALLLMMPFTDRGGTGLGALNAIFTATSAVCVTGLVVVDTATAFTPAGQAVIMLLIQIGGLGIMVLSYFTLFVSGRSVSVEDKALISYMLSENDTRNIRRTLFSIIAITFGVEAAGAVILYRVLGEAVPSAGPRIFYALFHSVSAFCNAGFALFSDSLESFAANPLVLVTIALLIIAGGLGFGVSANLVNLGSFSVRKRFSRDPGAPPRLTLNSRVVLVMTVMLVVSGMLLLYATEHGNTLRPLPTGRQYLNAFFQSVTLRTAGFNSIPFGSLTTTTLLIMIVYMFIGGAGGSTAGGVKVGSVAVIGAYIKAAATGSRTVLIGRHQVATGLVLNAFVIVFFGVLSVVAGTLIMTVSESAPLENILFETVSAFGTAGLSTGITGSLSSTGRVVIIVLMFLGRLGPLTVLSATARRHRNLAVSFPEAQIAVG